MESGERRMKKPTWQLYSGDYDTPEELKAAQELYQSCGFRTVTFLEPEVEPEDSTLLDAILYIIDQHVNDE